MAEKESEDQRTEEKGETRGIVVMPNIPGFTRQFNKIAKHHKFTVANKAESKVRDLTTSAKTPLGDKNTNVVYNIPCKCDKFAYIGETERNGLQEKENTKIK